jgi:hypothetical protein
MDRYKVRDVLAWLDERAKNSTSFGSHCHAYEVAARKLRDALSQDDLDRMTIDEIADAANEGN